MHTVSSQSNPFLFYVWVIFHGTDVFRFVCLAIHHLDNQIDFPLWVTMNNAVGNVSVNLIEKTLSLLFDHTPSREAPLSRGNSRVIFLNNCQPYYGMAEPFWYQEHTEVPISPAPCGCLCFNYRYFSRYKAMHLYVTHLVPSSVAIPVREMVAVLFLYRHRRGHPSPGRCWTLRTGADWCESGTSKTPLVGLPVSPVDQLLLRHCLCCCFSMTRALEHRKWQPVNDICIH